MKNESKTFDSKVLMMGMCTLLCASCVGPNNYGKVKIINPDEVAKDGIPEPQPQADFVSKINDVLIFTLRSDSIYGPSRLGTYELQISALEQSGYSSGFFDFGSRLSAVNVLFVNLSGDCYRLFESDRFISRMDLYSPREDEKPKNSRYYSLALDKNLYAVADEDSNEDGFLSDDDKQNLYSSDYDGRNLKLVLKDIYRFRMIDDNEVLILRDDGELQEFYLYMVESDQVIKLNTDI